MSDPPTLDSLVVQRNRGHIDVVGADARGLDNEGPAGIHIGIEVKGHPLEDGAGNLVDAVPRRHGEETQCAQNVPGARGTGVIVTRQARRIDREVRGQNLAHDLLRPLGSACVVVQKGNVEARLVR